MSNHGNEYDDTRGSAPRRTTSAARFVSHDNDNNQHTGAPSAAAAAAVPITAEVHYDMYEDDLGEGLPVYDAWAIEDDKYGFGGENDDHHHTNKRGGGRRAPSHDSALSASVFRTPAGRPASNELWRFRVRGCQDCWAALFFVALVGATVLWGISEVYHFTLTPDMMHVIYLNLGDGGQGPNGGGGTATTTVPWARADGGGSVRRGGAAKGKATTTTTTTANDSADDVAGSITMRDVFFSGWSYHRGAWWLLAWAAVAVLVAWLGLALLRRVPRQLIIAECWLSAACFAALSVSSLVARNLLGGFVLGVLSMLPLLWLYLVRDRIPFAVCLLRIASRIVQKHRGIVVVSLCAALLLVWHCLLTVCFLLPAILRAAAEAPLPADGMYILLLLFTLVWAQQVLTNSMHVVTAGVVATWYFSGGKMPAKPVQASVKRATTASFGSICFGSLFVAIIRFLRFLAHATRVTSGDDENFIACVCECFLSCIESVLRYFNIYAFVHVAIYGCSYVDAAQRTWALTQQCFFAAFFNDSLVGQAVDLLNYMLAIALGLAGAVVCCSIGLGVVVFFISVFVNSIVFQAVESTVTTVFVCFAELPEGLEVSFPELHAELMALDAAARIATVHHSGYGTMMG